ncbi:ELWxxDGT repeat protein [Spirosoma daeguense]
MKKHSLLSLLIVLFVTQHIVWAQIGTVNQVPTSFYIDLVKDINPGTDFSSPNNLIEMNGTLYFTADNGLSGHELWKSDGSESGTQLVKNINLTGNASPQSLINYNGTLFFSATNTTNGRELWKSDGTSAGTVLVKNINPSGDADPKALVVMNNILYFTADDGTNGRELWRTDGTSAGTVLVKNLNGTESGQANTYNKLMVMGNYLYFAALDNTPLGVKWGLWKSDGTSNGTSLVYSISVNTTPYGIQTLYPDLLGVAGGQLYYSYGYYENPNSYLSLLYKSTGTTAGTSLVKSFGNGTEIYGDTPAVLNNTLFFSVRTPGDGSPMEIWKSNGTESGTVRVKNTNPNGEDAVYNLKTFGSNVFFGAKNASNQTCLWKTDGTSANTVVVKEVWIGFLSEVNGNLFFCGNGEPWRSDGTTEGTRLLKNINPSDGSLVASIRFVGVGSRVFFGALGNASTGYELYKYVPCTYCPVNSGREGVDEITTGLQLRVLENPVRESLTVEINEPNGQPVSLHLTDMQGHILETRQLEPTPQIQRQVFKLNDKQTEMVLLRAVAGEQSATVRVLLKN